MVSPGPEVLKDRFTSLDTLALVRELRALGRARVDKAFDVAPHGWSLTLRAPGVGKRELLLVPGRFAAIVTEAPRHAEEPGPLARDLRRLLSGAVLDDVVDPQGERYLEIRMHRADVPEPLRLAVELFGVGNLLVARGETIVAVAHPKTWAHRSVRIGAPYVRPPQRANPWSASVPELASTLHASRTDRATTLAARLALGGPVAEELLERSGTPGTLPASTDPEPTAAALHRAMAELLNEVGERPRGFLYRRAEVAVDVEPFPSQRWRAVEDVREEERSSFSEAAEEYFRTLPPPAAPAAKAPPDPLGDLRRMRDRQLASVTQLSEEGEMLIAQGNALLTHYTEAEAALAQRPDGETGDSIEVQLGGLKVAVRRGVPIRDLARELFEEGKRVQAKLAGARDALRNTEQKLAVSAPASPPAPATSTPTAHRRQRQHWFEKHRWFLSSEGVVVIGGRDAASNDLIVRRYLNDRDLYVHADIHGAASVIVKQPPPDRAPAGEPTLREAAQWAVAFSKAWRAGLAAASAFWVRADQVSKAGASGEFVARGAWVIHGTKNVFRDLLTEVAIGTVRYEGEELWMVAPPDSFRERGDARFVLTPGPERERADREIELARSLGVSRDRLQSMLPAGGLTLRRA